MLDPDYPREIVELRRSGAAGPHKDKRTRRRRTRNADRGHAIRDSREA